jgi:hypothetical protein
MTWWGQILSPFRWRQIKEASMTQSAVPESADPVSD